MLMRGAILEAGGYISIENHRFQLRYVDFERLAEMPGIRIGIVARFLEYCQKRTHKASYYGQR